mmetsp:Transcript_55479/g.92185  ORF Transcript_55479/g.92185 Transcript_55479/m.92185 type:complete len:282 (-) Transcript_55479:170-1015(-)
MGCGECECERQRKKRRRRSRKGEKGKEKRRSDVEDGVDERSEDLDDLLALRLLELVSIRETVEADGLEEGLGEFGRVGRGLESLGEDRLGDVQTAVRDGTVLRGGDDLTDLGEEHVIGDREGLGHEHDSLLETAEDEQLLVLEISALQDRHQESEQQRGVRLIGRHVGVEQQLHSTQGTLNRRTLSDGKGHLAESEGVVALVGEESSEVAEEVGGVGFLGEFDEGGEKTDRVGLGGRVLDTLEKVASNGKRKVVVEAEASKLVEADQHGLDGTAARVHGKG